MQHTAATCSLAILIMVLQASAGASEKTKLLAGFEPEQMKVWLGKKLTEKNGVCSFRHGRGTVTLSKEDATEGKHCWRVALGKTNMDWGNKKNYTAIRYLKGRIFNGYGRVGQDPRLGKKRSPWLPGDWSGYQRLRLDVKSTDSAVQLRLHLFDQIALPPVERVFSVPAGKWVTLELDLAKASQLHEMALSEANQKKYGVEVAKVRTFNPAKMANFMVLVEKCEANTQFMMDNLRLVADEKAEEAKHPLVRDARPYPKPKELAPSSPKPVVLPEEAKGGAKLAASGKPYVMDISKERDHCYGKLSEMVHHAITSAGPEKIMLAQADFLPKRSLDGFKTWKSLGNLRHSRNAPGVGVAAAGPDLLGFYVARCHGASLPVDMFFRIVKFDGKDWVASSPYLADINSWHCPEFKVELIRLKSGRIWSVWMDCDRFNSYHNTLRGRYSDDGGKFWRDPDSNGTYIAPNPSSIGRPSPIGVTWWWEEPKIMPPVARANGHIHDSHPHTNFSITSCGDHLAVIYCSRRERISCQRFDGEKWLKPEVIVRGFGTPGSATTLGMDEIYFTYKGKVYRFADGKWGVDGPDEKGSAVVTACAGKVVCIGRKTTTADDQRTIELWSSQRSSDGAWSKPVVFSTEKTRKDKRGRFGRMDIIAPQFAHDGFVPVAWGPKNGWIKVVRLKVE